jgi:hypothetical protein
MTTSPRSLPSLKHRGQEGKDKENPTNILLVVADGELEMTGHNTVLLVVASSVACEFEDLGSEVFKDGSEVD